jgi:glycosyltransferase involved in cell wall biosynthesis
VKVREALAQVRFPGPIAHVAGTEVAYYQKPLASAAPLSPVRSTERPVQARAQHVQQPLRLLWEGDHQLLHSLSLVNRQFCLGLRRRGHDVRIGAEDPSRDRETAEVVVRQQWPPSFTPPSEGHWVMMQPWEFGSLPKAWVEPMIAQIDELWVNSRYVEEIYLQSGIPADRVHRIPLGVDTEQFHPGAPPLALKTTKRFKFLFVGGTIFRKGIDILLDAYTSAFRRSDDVCLVIKDMGVGTFYQGQTAEARIAELQADPRCTRDRVHPTIALGGRTGGALHGM